MITILTMLETGYESTYEHLAFRQLKGAFKVNLISVPHDYTTFQDALDSAIGTKIFMVPPGVVKTSVEFSGYALPPGDIIFCFGSPQETMASYIKDHIALHITTPAPVDMMAVCVAGMVLNVHG